MDVRVTRIDVVVVGSPGRHYASVLHDYEQRIGRYTKLQVHELRGEALQRGADRVLAEEGERIEHAVGRIRASQQSQLDVVLLDRTGTPLSSEQIAQRILTVPRLCLIVGGALGVHERVVRLADARISLGKLTMPHQLARLALTEQIYRSFRIARGEPYHY